MGLHTAVHGTDVWKEEERKTSKEPSLKLHMMVYKCKSVELLLFIFASFLTSNFSEKYITKSN